jgi:hypothetical protein
MKESKNFWSINIKDIKQDTFDLSIKNLNAVAVLIFHVILFWYQ